MEDYIETDRLFLRPLLSNDYLEINKWYVDSQVNKYMIYPSGSNELDVKKCLEKNNNPNNFYLGLVLKETNELIGWGGLRFNDSLDAWEIGYCIKKKMWGLGLVVEGVNSIINYVSSIRNIKMLYGICAIKNKNSRRVMEKLGLNLYRETEYIKLDYSKVFPAVEYRKYLD